MNRSEKIDQLAAALYAAQRELRNPPKDAEASIPTKQGGRFTFRYTSLPALIDHIRPALDAVSLAVVQYPGAGGLFTVVTHSSGQWLELGPYPLNGYSFASLSGDDQAFGSSLTYGRRAMLCALFFVAGDDADPDSADLEPGGRPDPPRTAQTPAGKGEADAPGPDAGERSGSGAHPGIDHKLGPAGNPTYANQGVKQCRIAGCDYVEWPAGVKG